VAFFELVNLSSGNRVGDYDTEQEALCDAWDAVRRRGDHALDAIALRYQDDYGNGEIKAEGEELVRRAYTASCTQAIAT
jgi:hypothetical protein